jgi:capsular polysaccharide transport system permease protein
MSHPVTKAQRPRSLRMSRTILALVLREMSTSYGRTSLGYLWAFIEPVAGIALLTLVFSAIGAHPPVGTSFALFYATGLLPFTIYSGITSKVATSLRFSAPLLFYPGVTFVDAMLARLILNGLTETVVFTTVITLIIVGQGLDVILDIPALVLGIAMILALATGIGSLNCFLMAMFPVWERAWAILNRPVVIISCIFFPLHSVPLPWRDYLWFNPIVHLVGQIRSGVYPTYDAAYVSPLYIFGLSAGLTMMGLIMLTRYKSYILNDG